MYFIKHFFIIVILTVVFSCESSTTVDQQRLQREEASYMSKGDAIEEERVDEIDSSLYKSGERLLRNLVKGDFEASKKSCLTTCALSYFLQQEFDTIQHFEIKTFYLKHHLGFVHVAINDIDDPYRMVFTQEDDEWKFFLLWPKKRLVWYDCLDDPTLMDLVYQVAEIENNH